MTSTISESSSAKNCDNVIPNALQITVRYGISMIGIAILCSVNAMIGIFFSTIPFIVLAFIDGSIKIGFGIYLLFFSKPTKSR